MSALAIRPLQLGGSAASYSRTTCAATRLVKTGKTEKRRCVGKHACMHAVAKGCCCRHWPTPTTGLYTMKQSAHRRSAI